MNISLSKINESKSGMVFIEIKGKNLNNFEKDKYTTINIFEKQAIANYIDISIFDNFFFFFINKTVILNIRIFT